MFYVLCVCFVYKKEKKYDVFVLCCSSDLKKNA